jgi:hypothetical protein
MIIILAVFLISSDAGASISARSSVDVQLKSLISARSEEELKQNTALNAAVEELGLQCEAEIAANRLPVACFSSANLALKHHLISLSEFWKREKKLTSLCRKLSRSSKDARSLQVAIASEIPDSCRKSIQKRIDDLAYQNEDVRSLDRILN